MRVRTLRTSLLATLLVLAFVGTVAYLWTERSQSEVAFSDPRPAVRAGQPAVVQMTVSFSGTLLVETTQSIAIRAPEWEGLVTSVVTGPGETISDGSEIVTVDGITRRLGVSDAPFYRPLAIGAKGDDVADLHELLLRWKYLDDVPRYPSSFSSLTRRAVRRLAEDIGADRLTNRFEPSWILWAPSRVDLEVAELDLVVGAVAPAGGSIVIESVSSVGNYSIEPAADASPQDLTGRWVGSFQDEDLSDIEISLVDERIDHEALTDLLLTAEQRDIIDLAPDSAYEFDTRFESARRRRFLSVPVTSLRPSTDGSTVCVFARQSEAEAWTAVAVSPSDSPGSNVALEPVPGLAEGEVLFNPAEALAETPCP